MKIAYISTYPPRECGLATFNCNLVSAINKWAKQTIDDTIVFAMNEGDDIEEYKYGPEVKYVIRQNNQNDYLRAVEYINTGLAEAVILEHEFGIFGGEDGVYILPLVARLKKPLITILHTVLREPSFMQQTIIREIARHSDKVVVMSRKAVDFLRNIYGISEDKILFIEHGVPDLDKEEYPELRNTPAFKDKKVLLTFGLLSRNKGLETVIKAMPKIVARHPNAVYIIVGATHPAVKKNSGEEYRDSLKRLARQLGVEENIYFINKFVVENELHKYLSACDIYVTPYLNEAQITSGTLSYAVGAGAAVVSTPYWHAQELLANNKGRLFNFQDADGLAEIVNELFDDDKKLTELKTNAYEYGKILRWPKIGGQYVKAFQNVLAGADKAKAQVKPIIDTDTMPSFSLAHITRLTDDTGIVQHATYGIPNLKEGYCVDDNSRALIMALLAYQQYKSQTSLDLLPIYLSFIQYMQLEDGNFRNFLSFDRRYLDEEGTDDSFGRTVWCLGMLVRDAPNNSYKEFGKELFLKSIPHFHKLHYLRGFANTMIGIAHYLEVYKSDELLLKELDELANRLKLSYSQNRDDKWHWFEPQLTYDNAILPLALLHHYEITGNQESLFIAEESISFLTNATLSNGYLNPVGNKGWYFKGQSIALYDQQAIETMAMVFMYYQAYHVTENIEYLKLMNLSYQWFLGENSLHLPLYDYETKGSGDGLQIDGVNRNQGAESTLAYLISHLMVLKAFRAVEHPVKHV